MKKLVLTIAIVLGIGFSALAQHTGGPFSQNTGGGLFKYGTISDEEFYGYNNFYDVTRTTNPLFPGHLSDAHQNADVPLGGGALLLLGFGAA